MTDDLVKRLRDRDAYAKSNGWDNVVFGQAADRIEELEKQLVAATLREQSPEMSRADYWESQASMWHENYKEAMAHEEEARRYKVALERIRDSGYGTKERIRQIIKKALGENKE